MEDGIIVGGGDEDTTNEPTPRKGMAIPARKPAGYAEFSVGEL